MNIVLDASMALAWLIVRADGTEAALANRAFGEVSANGAEVPALWYAEVANTLLVFERAKRLTEQDSVSYLADLGLLAIAQDDLPCARSDCLRRCLSGIGDATGRGVGYLRPQAGWGGKGGRGAGVWGSDVGSFPKLYLSRRLKNVLGYHRPEGEIGHHHERSGNQYSCSRCGL